MKVLIIGLGSIARKHIQALKKVNSDVQLFALRSTNANNEIGIQNIYSSSEIPSDIQFVIISNPTSLHGQTILDLLYLKKPLFIEKPTLSSLAFADEISRGLSNNKIVSYCAFNLRFHPCLTWLKQNLPADGVLELNAYCGSYLPDWRKNSDYKKSYSARAILGGGVHLDLIHEMDYVLWLLGKPLQHSGMIRKLSNLEIDSNDYAHYILNYPDAVATISLNYYRRSAKRNCEIVFHDKVWNIDLIRNMIVDDYGNILFQSSAQPQEMYDEQMRYFVNCLDTQISPMNMFDESLDALSLCLDVHSSIN